MPLSDGLTDDCSDGRLCLSTPGGGSSCFSICDTTSPQCDAAQPNCQAPYNSATPGVCVLCSGEYVTQEKSAENRLYYDYSHNQEGAPQEPGVPTPLVSMEIFVQLAGAQALSVANLNNGIRKVCLSDCDILFISTPKTVFTAEEKSAVVEYVTEGGRLLFSMDDDVHSSLAQSESNDILAPFGLSFGALVPQTAGAFTYAGTAVTPTQRNITYLSGRVAAGGTPFIEINNTAGLRSGVFAEPAGGGRVVAVAENTPFIDAFINDQDNVAFVNDVLQYLLQ